MNVRSRRALWSWMARAMSSLPVPDSPSTNVVVSGGAGGGEGGDSPHHLLQGRTLRDEPRHAVLTHDFTQVAIFDLQSSLHGLDLLEGARRGDGGSDVVGQDSQDVEACRRDGHAQE